MTRVDDGRDSRRERPRLRRSRQGGCKSAHTIGILTEHWHEYRRRGFGVTLALTASGMCLWASADITERLARYYGHCGMGLLIPARAYDECGPRTIGAAIIGCVIATYFRYGVRVARSATLVALGIWGLFYLCRRFAP